jgi:HKD family nuclease
VTSNNSPERTAVTDGEENVRNTILKFFSKADKIDSCVDHRATSQAIGVELYKKLLIDLKNRGVKLRYITEVTREIFLLRRDNEVC